MSHYIFKNSWLSFYSANLGMWAVLSLQTCRLATVALDITSSYHSVHKWKWGCGDGGGGIAKNIYPSSHLLSKRKIFSLGSSLFYWQGKGWVAHAGWFIDSGEDACGEFRLIHVIFWHWPLITGIIGLVLCLLVKSLREWQLTVSTPVYHWWILSWPVVWLSYFRMMIFDWIR